MQLEEIVKNKEYSRLSIGTKEKLINNNKLEIQDLIPNPILNRNKNNVEIINEKVWIKNIIKDVFFML